jgi:hypothetical protein
MSSLKRLGRLYCAQYETMATFYVEPAKDQASLRHLVVHYEAGRSPFRAGIPNSWSEDDVVDNAMVVDNGTCPAWEQAARMLGSPTLVRWSNA